VPSTSRRRWSALCEEIADGTNPLTITAFLFRKETVQ